MILRRALALLALLSPVSTQQINALWETRPNGGARLTPSELPPPNFSDQPIVGDAHIQIHEDIVKQRMDGFGATLTESSAALLYNLKNANSYRYEELLKVLFNPLDFWFVTAGMTVLRIPLGASEFSDKAYSFADESGDHRLSKFSLDNAPQSLWTVLSDIQSINKDIKLFFVPWSPPFWMKDSNSMRNGSLLLEHHDTYAKYLWKCVRDLDARGFKPYALALQNEPESWASVNASTVLDAQSEAKIGIKLRSLLDHNGFQNVKLIANEHNWSHADDYASAVMELAAHAFSGVSFHCYEGSPYQQKAFADRYPDKEIYVTECARTFGGWNTWKYDMADLFITAVSYSARTVMLGPLVLTADNPFMGVVTINRDSVNGRGWELNPGYYALAHSSKAVLPLGPGGPFANVVGVTAEGSRTAEVQAIAYVTRGAKFGYWDRYSVVALHWTDHVNIYGEWPAVVTTISFRGKRASISLPVGLTTFTFYAKNENPENDDTGEKAIITELDPPTPVNNYKGINGRSLICLGFLAFILFVGRRSGWRIWFNRLCGC